MKTCAIRLFLAVALPVVVSAVWAGQSVAGASLPTALHCTPSHHVVCIDKADSGHSLHVRVGQTLRVDLQSAGLSWAGLRQVGSRPLHENGSTDYHAGGLSASYGALKKGKTELLASGAPKCSPGEVCPQFIVLWRVQVVVS
jgi:hypothetical protein